MLDRLYGYSLSPFLWKRVRPGLSAGRVQSVAVRLLVERERERIAFVSSEYWDLKAKLGTNGSSFEARLARIDGTRLADGKSFDADTGELVREHRHLEEKEAKALSDAAASSEPWKVTSLETKPGQQKPAPPFITSTLQQEGNRKLRYTSRRTMDIAQQLYEGIELGGERVGLITYMRTDSVTLSGRALAQAREVIADAYGKDYLPKKPIQYKTKAKRAQEAHEAIRPTDLSRRPKDVAKYLNADQLKLYELIWKRTLACQMVPARFERTQLEVSIDVAGSSGSGEKGTETLAFTASGKRIVFPGFLRAYVEGSDDPEAELGDQETILPALEEGQVLAAKQVDAEGHIHQAALSLHRGEPGQEAGGRGHRPTQHLRVDHLHRAGSRLRAEEGQRADPHLRRVLRHGAAGEPVLRPGGHELHRADGRRPRRDRRRQHSLGRAGARLLLRRRRRAGQR